LNFSNAKNISLLKENTFVDNNVEPVVEKEEKKEFHSFYQLFLNYTEFSTIQGFNVPTFYVQNLRKHCLAAFSCTCNKRKSAETTFVQKKLCEKFVRKMLMKLTKGLNYIFISYQTMIGRIFWTLTLILMFLLGSYWCNQSYQDWQDNPVQTTITTTSFPINEVIHRHLQCIE